MTEYFSDKEQVEMIKKWLGNYGIKILMLIATGLLFGFGWQYWTSLQNKKSEQASELYMQLQVMLSRGKQAEFQQLADELIKNYTQTPYATMAALLSAKEEITQDHLDKALMRLNWVIENTKTPALKQMASLRSARILLAQNHPQKALDLLHTVDEPAYRPLVDYLEGDIYRAQGNEVLAKEAYGRAQRGMKTLEIDEPYLAMKISN